MSLFFIKNKEQDCSMTSKGIGVHKTYYNYLTQTITYNEELMQLTGQDGSK